MYRSEDRFTPQLRGSSWWRLQRDGVKDDFAAVGNYGQLTYIPPHGNLNIVGIREKSGIDFIEWLGFFSLVAATTEEEA